MAPALRAPDARRQALLRSEEAGREDAASCAPPLRPYGNRRSHWLRSGMGLGRQYRGRADNAPTRDARYARRPRISSAASPRHHPFLRRTNDEHNHHHTSCRHAGDGNPRFRRIRHGRHCRDGKRADGRTAVLAEPVVPRQRIVDAASPRLGRGRSRNLVGQLGTC